MLFSCVLHAESMDELSFKSGELIMLKTRYGTNWFRGKLINGKEGIFPNNYVEVVVRVRLQGDRSKNALIGDLHDYVTYCLLMVSVNHPPHRKCIGIHD